MHYYPDDQSKENLAKIRRESCCVECGRQVAIFLDLSDKRQYIACSGGQHKGITREYKPPVEDYETNIRREMDMTKEHGTTVTTKLAKYEGIVSLDKVGAREIINTVFPEAPEAEVARAVLLCVNYQLNPLMNHVYLIPFQKRENGKVVGTDWVTIIGRGAKRLMASRRGPYSYIENTPRVMTQQEQLDTFGEYDEDKLWCITRLQDPKTGATSVGYGFWPKTKPVYNKPGERQPNQPKGTDKGNSMFNMASGRSENQALDRLRPGEMPTNVAVMDEGLAESALDGKLEAEDYIEGKARVITEEQPGPSGPAEEPPDPLEPVVEAEATAIEGKVVEQEQSPKLMPEGSPAPDLSKSIIDIAWLRESVKELQDKGQKAYEDESLLSYMRSVYKGVDGNTIYEIAANLDKGMAKHLDNVIRDALSGKS